MSYEVKITAASLGELADKLIAMGAQLSIPAEVGLQRVASAIMPEVEEHQTRTRSRAKAAAAEQAPVVQPEPEAVQPEVEQASEPEETAEEAAPATLDFDKDVAPRVLAVVGKKGKPVMQEILSEFGVERASQIPADVMAEFVEVLDKELAE